MKRLGIVMGIVLCMGIAVKMTQADSFSETMSSWRAFIGKWKALQDVAEQRVNELKNKLRALWEVEKGYDHGVAYVRVGNHLSDGERHCVEKRKQKISHVLQKQFDVTIDPERVPVVSVAISGGGYRAMLGTIGFLSGLEKIGVLDLTTYLSCLSGSTWAVMPWIGMGKTLSQLRTYITAQIERDIAEVTPQELQLITKALTQKKLLGYPLTAVDLYGALLANRLLAEFGGQRQTACLSELTAFIEDGNYPYPIGTAIDARMAVAKNPHWFEFTPHEIGSAYFGMYIPTWAYGREFKNGKSVEHKPEFPLGFQLGTFGSAFGVNVEFAWNRISHKLKDSWFKNVINTLVERNAGKRVFWADVPNYMFAMKGSELEQRELLKLVDAGLAFNLPYPPISGERSERKPDIIIICDMSATGHGVVMKQAEEYARAKKLPFPSVDYTDIEKRTISIFKDENDSSVPVVIYMPRFGDQELWKKSEQQMRDEYGSIEAFDFDICAEKGFCKTSQFRYNRADSQKVIEQMEFNVLVNKNKIIDAIRAVIKD